MADKPHFSPTDTYVLDDTVIQDTDELRLTSILREMDLQVRGEKAAEPEPAKPKPGEPGYNPLLD